MSFCRAPRCPALCRVQPVGHSLSVSFRYHCLCHPCCPGGRCLPSDLVRPPTFVMELPPPSHSCCGAQITAKVCRELWMCPEELEGRGSLITLTCTQPPRPQGHPPRSPLSLTPAQPPTPTAAHPALRGLPLLPLLLPVPGQPCSQHALRPAPWRSLGLPEATACPDSHSQIESKTN